MRAFAVQIPQYEGPLELLLSILRRNELSISDIPLAPIAAQYLAYIKDAEALDVNLGMEWIDMAARLIHWKSSSLLPTDPALPDPGVSLAQELSRELKTLSDTELRKATGFLAVRNEERERLWTQTSEEGFRELLPAEEESFASLWTIRRKAQNLRALFLRSRVREGPVFDTTVDSMNVEIMIQWARLRLAESEIGLPVPAESWFAIMVPLGHKIGLFLALLELARNAEVQLDEYPDEGVVWITPLFSTYRCDTYTD